MAASLLSMRGFVRNGAAGKQTGPWTNQERAELSRVVNLLGRAGLLVEVESGMTDEGDPWFIFAHPDSGDVIAHIARIDGRFVAAGANAGVLLDGRDFREIVDKMMASQPLLFGQGPSAADAGLGHPPERAAACGGQGAPFTGGDRFEADAHASRSGGSNVTTLFTHPSVLLAAFVATALMQGSNRKVADGGASASGMSGSSKSAFEARTNAPTSRAQLNDALISLTGPDGAGAGAAGHGGFMLHSTGLASAMALVVAAATPVGSDGDAATSPMMAALANGRPLHAPTGPQDSSAEGRDSGASPAQGAQAAQGHGPRGLESGSAGQDAAHHAEGEGLLGPLPKCPETAAAAVNGSTAGSAADDTVVDPDLLLAELMIAIEAKAGPDAQTTDPSPRDTTPAETSARLAAAEAMAQDGDGTGTGTDAETGTGASDAGGSAGSRANASADRLTTGDYPADGSSAGASAPGSGESGADPATGSGAVSGSGKDSGRDEKHGMIVRVDARDDLSDEILLADWLEEAANKDGQAALEDIAQATAAGKSLVVFGDPASPDRDARNFNAAEAGTDRGDGGQVIVFTGGRMVVETFDPGQDTISVIGEAASRAFYQLIPTDDGVEVRFGEGDTVALVGVTLDDLGFA